MSQEKETNLFPWRMAGLAMCLLFLVTAPVSMLFTLACSWIMLNYGRGRCTTTARICITAAFCMLSAFLWGFEYAAYSMPLSLMAVAGPVLLCMPAKKTAAAAANTAESCKLPVHVAKATAPAAIEPEVIDAQVVQPGDEHKSVVIMAEERCIKQTLILMEVNDGI